MYLGLSIFVLAPLFFFFVLQPLYNVFFNLLFFVMSRDLFFFLSIAATLVILLTVFNCGYYFVEKLYTNFFPLSILCLKKSKYLMKYYFYLTW